MSRCLLSIVGCVPAITRSTTCSSALGIIRGEEVLNTTSTYYLKFRKYCVIILLPADSETMYMSHVFPLVDIFHYERLDTEGCTGCKRDGVWRTSEVGVTRYSFCESDEQGYVSRLCYIGDRGSGTWGDADDSECDVVSDPIVESGEGWFRGKIVVGFGLYC